MISTRLFYLMIGFIFLASCKPSIQITESIDGSSSYTTYNIHKTKKPLAVVLPEVQSDVFTEAVLTKLSRRYRIIYMPFIHENNKERQVQMDGLVNRTNYYGTQLTQLLVDINARPEVFFAEGFNSLLVLPMATAYNTPKIFFVNGLHQSLNNIIITNCFGGDTSACANLINHLQLFTRVKLEELLQFTYSANYDPNLGKYSSNFWLEVINYTTAFQQPYYKGNKTFIYFKESGLLRAGDLKNLNTSSSTTQYKIISKKEFSEKPLSIFSN